jgi:hypothetical protein
VVLVDRGVLPFLFEQFGSHARAVHTALWALSYHLFGLASEPYMWAVLLTHLLNVWLLCRMLDRLSGRPLLAAVGAAWWGTSPLHVGALGWYSVYAHVLAGTFILCVLAQASAIVSAGKPVTFGTAVGWIALLALAANSFGTGVGAAISIPLALLVCLPAYGTSFAARVVLLGAPVFAVLDYLGMRALGQRVAPSIDNLAIFQASWTNLDVLADQGRMLADLVVVGFGGLLTGHLLPRSRPAVELWLSLVACLGGMAVIGVGAMRADRTIQRWILTQLGVAIGLYGVIAIGRASLGRAFGLAPEAAALSSRYHYAATLPLTAAFVLALATIARPRSVLLVGLAVALQAGAWWQSQFAIPSHPEARAFVANAQQRIAALARAAPPATDVLIGNVPAPPAVLGVVDPADFPGWAGVFVITQPTDEVAGHRVVFAEPSPRIRNAHLAPASRRLSRLLVRPPLRLGATCELSAALHALDLGRELLACPLGTPAAEACVTTVRRRSTATAGRACQGADPRVLADRVSALAVVARAVLSCPAAAAGGDHARPHHVLRRLGLLVSELGACHREAVVSRRGLADAACVERATARYDRQVSGLALACRARLDVRTFGPAARNAVRDLLDEALCKAMVPGAVKYEPAAPTATLSPATAARPG